MAREGFGCESEGTVTAFSVCLIHFTPGIQKQALQRSNHPLGLMIDLRSGEVSSCLALLIGLEEKLKNKQPITACFRMNSTKTITLLS